METQTKTLECSGEVETPLGEVAGRSGVFEGSHRPAGVLLEALLLAQPFNHLRPPTFEKENIVCR